VLPHHHFIAAASLTALGLWLMLPPSGEWRRALGLVVTASGFGWLMSRMPGLGSWSNDLAFWALAAATAASAVAAVVSRNPVYSALWFAMSLLGTAGVFALQGAQFLAVATIVVYAGAIVVTFLFVLWLAQPDGTAYYDRVSWGRGVSLLAVVAPAVLVSTLAMILANAFADHAAIAPTAEALTAGVNHPQHVAQLGATLFTQHLVAVELAGTLLLVALVGAVAITAQERSASRHLPLDAQQRAADRHGEGARYE
jgi:NADH-quinone oxidoreductase subunit J